MKVTRLDLDGTGSPIGLVKKILANEPDLPIPTPIEELAHQLDIKHIRAMETQGFEGGLITDEDRSTGIILVNETAPMARKRFTIAHELAHFLIITHVPVQPGVFQCTRKDMQRWSAPQTNRYGRMEAEANQFAALMLMPPPALRSFFKRKRDPDLQHIPLMARHFGVSKEAASRSYVTYNDNQIAILVAKDNVIMRVYQHPEFPRMSTSSHQAVPSGSLLLHSRLQLNVASELSETLPENWLSLRPDRRLPTLYEQIYPQRNGFALILLWAESIEAEADDENDERTAKQRFDERRSRWGG